MSFATAAKSSMGGKQSFAAHETKVSFAGRRVNSLRLRQWRLWSACVRRSSETKEIRSEELLSISIEDGHNYLCIQKDDFQWECIIVNDVLDTQRNTLILE